VHGYDDVRAQGLRDVDGKVVRDSSVDVVAAVHSVRREYGGEAHARPHRVGDVPAAEGHRISALEVRRHRAIGYREPVEIDVGRHVEREPIEEVEDVAPVEEAPLRLESLAVEVQAREVAGFVPIREDRAALGAGVLGEKLVPIRARDERLEAVRVVADAVEPAY
jgi:hypothetical protein